MRRRKPRPASEEASGIYFNLLFGAVWCSFIVRILADSGFQPALLLYVWPCFFLFKLPIQQFRKAAKARQAHRKVMEEIAPLPGNIVEIHRKDIPSRTRRGMLWYSYHYILQVEYREPGASIPRRITSEPYLRPIQNDLASTRVNVYPLPDGWHFILDDFDLKEYPGAPGPFPYEKKPPKYPLFFTTAFTLFCLYFLYILFTS